MNNTQMLALFDQDQRYNITYPDLRREVTPRVVRHLNISNAGEDAIIYSRLDEKNADAEIRAQIAYFEDVGQSPVTIRGSYPPGFTGLPDTAAYPTPLDATRNMNQTGDWFSCRSSSRIRRCGQL